MDGEKDLELHLKVERCLERLRELGNDVTEVKRDVKSLKRLDLRVDRLEQARASTRKWSWTFIPLIAGLVVNAVWSKLGGK
jgi:hypothetical protein